MTALGVAAVVVLVGALLAGAYFVISDNGSAGAKASKATGHVNQRDISSQQVDPAPLTEAEVFPAPSITPNQGGLVYQLVKSQSSNDCRTGAAGDLATMLTSQGCTQFVRGTLISADKVYVITAGIFNLKTAASADQANSLIKTSIDARKGRLTGFPAGGGSDAIGRSATVLGWDTQGHYLAYCLVARADDRAIDATDQNVQQIINGVVENHLRGTVIQARVATPAANQPAPRPSPSRTVRK
jgi:hypothetical protein